MKEFKSGSYVAFWDDELKLGDLITAYHQGYHELVKIELRRSNTPLFHYVMRFDSNGRPSKAKRVRTCDAAYCRSALTNLEKEIEKREEEVLKLNGLRNNLLELKNKV